jgi:membrane protease YdiL (CAAX protease family)
MDRPQKLHKYLIPIAVYILLISLIFLMMHIISWSLAATASAFLMLSVSLILKSDMKDLGWDPRGALTGLAVTIAILLVYTAVLAGYGLYAGKSLTFNKLSYSFILIQLLLVALPEEIFFRGYLQQKLGNTVKGIIAVSLLFALAHFVTLCLGGGHGLSVCSQAVLTFFPSLVMGYLYMSTGTLWASIIFHFLANIVHISAGLS